ncbi:MAG: hypothetical protein KBD19_02115 [Candidatus Moranbacteria bacterium]|nr:hypothetical protein [Candidatus Moranbacteria bacterium]
MSESGNYIVKPVYVVRNIDIVDGALVDVVEPPGIRDLNDLAAMIGILHGGVFTLPAESHWFLVYAGNEPGSMLGYVEVIEETGAKWSYGHIHITDSDAAKATFARIREAAATIGRTIDDRHPDHEWYARQLSRA